MPDHVHLIVHPNQPDYDIRKFLTLIKLPTYRRALAYLRNDATDWLDRVRVQRGSRIEYRFWQPGGGFDRNITEPNTLRRMIDYIHLNPVRKGLVGRASDWKWSSAAWFINQEQHSHLKLAPMPYEWTIGMAED